MNVATVSPASGSDVDADISPRLRDLERSIEHAAHLLPSQGPITVFVHHNTLHAFEDLSFDAGVKQGGLIFGCNAYLPEDRYRQKLARGRFRVKDLEAVLMEDLSDEADRLVASFGTRYSLQLAMLQFPLRTGPAAELRWVIEETDGLRRFRKEVNDSVRQRMIATTRQWVMQARQDDQNESHEVLVGLFKSFGTRMMSAWSDRKWEAFVLHFLWQTCHNGVYALQQPTNGSQPFVRHRDLLLDSTGQDTDELVHELLIRFCSAILDQGFAAWEMPDRDAGLYRAFLNLYSKPYAAPTRWLSKLQNEVDRLVTKSVTPLQSIDESLSILGVSADDRDEFITQSLLALRGWAGMVWQMESNAEWAPRPAPEGSLVQFLAIRLILDRLACDYISPGCLSHECPFDRLRSLAGESAAAGESGVERTDQRVFTVFQLAQVRGWQPEDLLQLSPEQWTTLVDEIGAFSNIERRRIYHLAFERKYRNETLDAVAIHSRRKREPTARAANPNGAGVFESGPGASAFGSGLSVDSAESIASSPNAGKPRPAYQLVCCIDDREESFRRHLEELDSDCETFGVAGFYGVAMYYRGAADAHFTPLCPVNIKPRHFVIEESVYSQQQSSQRRAEARRRIGRASHQTHVETRSLAGGLLTGLFGSLAAFPLVARILFPRTTAQLRRHFDRFVQPPMTQLRLERLDAEPGSANGQLGYSVVEMVDIVAGGLRAIGLSKSELFSQLVVICGHGSSSLNNPHEAAHDCGACGGGRGGPNARAFAQMANDVRVRRQLGERGLLIPNDTIFVGGYHNTCDDSMTWYDLDRVPITHRKRFERAQSALDEARKRSAHERCRRFESADLNLSIDDALRHVEGRAEDLSQPRPEYGHATNALCFVGRRAWSRGLFLDRRAFLTSYDPSQDDERSSILEGLLRAVIPVCAGINLEYYFSYVDPLGYGCGTKLPHNITSLLGVMDGAASDLRPGLPWQMVEIHEPVRLLFVIETSRCAMQRIIDENEGIQKLVNGHWVQLAILDAATSQIHRYKNGQFELYKPATSELPLMAASTGWYAGQRDHLGFASIREQPPNQQLQEMEVRHDG